MSEDKVFIFDTTLRDGEQSPGCSMNLGEKLRMAAQLEQLHVIVDGITLNKPTKAYLQNADQ